MDAAPAFSPEVPHGTRLEERWEILKPTIEFWYLEKNLSVAKLAKHMKENHGFDAIEHQYKFQFKKWGLKKNIRAKEKANIERAVMARADLGRSTVVEYKGRKVNPKKIRRHANNAKRKDMLLRDPDAGVGGSVVAEGKLSFGKNIFLNWFIPFGDLKGSPAGQFSHPSPFTRVSPLEGFAMRTPSDGGTPSTTRRSQSQMTSDVMKRAAIERAHWFMNGQHEKLLKSLTMPEARVVSTWLHQFWMFGFKTAKHWGFSSGPWNAHELGFDGLGVFGSAKSPNSPQCITGSDFQHPQSPSRDSSSSSFHTPEPSQLCRWTVHVKEIRSVSGHVGQSAPLQPTWQDPPVQETLRDALEHNDFTSIDPEQLPVAIPHVAKHTEKSPNELLLESFGFAIMSRNVDLVESLLWEIDEYGSLDTIHPLHLAIDYLDGSKACCKIIELLVSELSEQTYSTIQDFQTNDSGYTPYDSLMITIIKSHTSLAPSILDTTNKEKRFRGEEVSICGRWDADSDCIRGLLSAGSPNVPSKWKHKFCHTSVQAICHSMAKIAVAFPRHTTTESGLFLKHCTSCGLKLQLSQLHTLVLVAYLLSGAGCEDEDLFGMIACLLCFYGNLNEPTPESEASLTLLFDMDADCMETCTHQKYSPAEFAHALRSFRTCRWTEKCATGWELFQLILDRGEQAWGKLLTRHASEFGPEYCLEHELVTMLSADEKLATIWAATQTELLTYRRLSLTDPWLSDKFNMQELLQSLKDGEEPSSAIVELMNPRRCQCGSFDYGWIARVEDVSAQEFSNFSHLDDPERTAYVLDSY